MKLPKLTFERLRAIPYQQDWEAPLAAFFDAALDAEIDEPAPALPAGTEPWRGLPPDWREFKANHLDGKFGLCRRFALNHDEVAVYERKDGSLWAVALVDDELRMVALERG